MTTLRVCHLGKYYPPATGGIETHLRTLAQGQSKRGVSVKVMCFNHERGPTRHEQDEAVEVVRVRRLTSVAKLDVAPELVRALARTDADVIHMQAPNPGGILALLMARPRVPVVVTYQSDVVRQRILGKLFSPLERLFYRNVRVVLATSPNYAKGSPFLANYTGRLAVLPMGIDLSPYLHPSHNHLEEANRIRDRYPGPLWLACGRLVYYKGLETAVAALNKVPGKLLIVGDGPDRPSLERATVEAGVQARVVFLGSLPYQDIVPYYLASTAFWFPSNARSEAFGLVQAEAMASGCPVLNTDLPGSGVPWVSRHDESGLTVPINDPASLAAAAQRLLDEPSLRSRLAEGGRRRAERDFDHEVMVARSLAVYRGILAGKSVQSLCEDSGCVAA